ncbi:MAG TPA: CaiB/BaiF CoA-transferase family protein [Bordetella sp.]
MDSASSPTRAGPLAGLRVVEFGGIGPAPFAAMLLADLGAQVLRIERLQPADIGIKKPAQYDLLARGRSVLRVDLKHPDGVACAQAMLARSDGLIEGFRPGVMERMGLSPGACLARNPGLVYGRVTGWGQDGPLAQSAGHDLNYIALTGVLHAIGRHDAPPTPPLNLVGDFGGGGMLLAFGMVCALLERQRSGRGQVVDAAMIDGAATLMTSIYGMMAAGLHAAPRGGNLLDSGAPHYDVYRCADGQYLAVAPIEKKFREALFGRLGWAPDDFPDLDDAANWPATRERLAALFATDTQRNWCDRLAGADACVTPVLSAAQAQRHPHHQARSTFVEIDGVLQPAPSPRFSRTPPAPPQSVRQMPGGAAALLRHWGVESDRIGEWIRDGVVA